MIHGIIRAVRHDDVPATTYLLVCSALCLWTLLVYWSVLNAEFISYDDPLYIQDRSQISNGLTPGSIRWALTATSDANWIPVTWLSYLLDTSLFGVSPRGYHAVNLFFHLLNTALLMIMLQRMTGYFWRSAVVAALFALHPLHVESVAWIAERKDVLSGFFFILTLLSYHWYSTRPSMSRYVLTVLLYVLGLCSKSMLVTMPFLLLLLDYWPLKRLLCDSEAGISLKKRLVEKLPFFCCAFVSGIITYSVQKQGGAVVEYASSSLLDNSMNALVSYVTYLFKSFLPINLSIAYLFDDDLPFWQPLGAALLLIGGSYGILFFQRERRYLLVGWLWFLGMLVPVIGIVRLGSQSMADRYTYLPHIGLFIMLVWWVAESPFKIAGRNTVIAVTMIITALLSYLTWKQTAYWQNSIALFNHAINVTDNNWVAFEHLGSAFAKRSDITKAYTYTQESLRINPRNAVAYMNLGIIYTHLENGEEALRCFYRAIELNPNYAKAHYRLGVNLVFIGDIGGALTEYKILTELDPELAEYLMKLISRDGSTLKPAEY